MDQFVKIIFYTYRDVFILLLLHLLILIVCWFTVIQFVYSEQTNTNVLYANCLDIEMTSFFFMNLLETLNIHNDYRSGVKCHPFTPRLLYPRTTRHWKPPIFLSRVFLIPLWSSYRAIFLVVSRNRRQDSILFKTPLRFSYIRTNLAG